MNIEVMADDESAARRAAAIIAEEAWASTAARGKFILAVSGGHTPWVMLRQLANERLPWRAIRIVQVDERVAPSGHPDRNLTHIRESLLDRAPLQSEQIHAMPVESSELESAAAHYAESLLEIAGAPPVLDLVHLGLGPDGHTASLIPGDPVLETENQDVALTGTYQGRRRMTLTYPILNRARRILWVATGSEKAEMVKRLLEGDPSIPAGLVSRDHATLVADSAAAGRRNRGTTARA